jgi:WhiB family transcriptional regulator, redox-sensing transcriptional regulator
MSYRESAPCYGKHQDIWFPPLDEKSEKYDRVARLVCSSCDVWDKCLTEALNNEEPWGTWGGLTAPERRAAAGTASTRSLRPHGTWMRFRQGCRCTTCKNAHRDRRTIKDFSFIPKCQESLDVEYVTIRSLGVR